MNRKLVLAILITALSAIVYCGDDKPSEDQFADVCATVAKCDQELSQLAQTQGKDAAAICSESLAGLEKKVPGVTGPVVECIKTTECSELSFMVCAAKVQDKLQNLVPGAGM